MKLPFALQSWQPWLKFFDAEHIAELSPMLQKLDAAIGQLRGGLPAGEERFIGMEDLRRRGPYERLLLSEWLLADEVPDEFLRRAAQGEHLFLHPRFAKPKSSMPIHAVFDAGPFQIGAPRVLHIALWIVLSRRAALRQSPLLTLIAQRAKNLSEGVQSPVPDILGVQATDISNSLSQPSDPSDPSTVLQKLLAARTWQSASIESWAQRLRDLDGESWWIGPQAHPDADVSVLSEFSAGQLRVELKTQTKNKALILDLPPGASQLLAGRFYRDAGHRAVASVDTSQLKTMGLVMSNTAAHYAVVLRQSAHYVSAARLFNKPYEIPAQSQYGQGEWPVLVALHSKRVIGIVRSDKQARFWGVPGFHKVCSVPIETLPFAVDAHQSLGAFYAPGAAAFGVKSPSLRLIDQAQQLWISKLSENQTDCQWVRASTQVLGYARDDQYEHMMSIQDGQLLVSETLHGPLESMVFSQQLRAALFMRGEILWALLQQDRLVKIYKLRRGKGLMQWQDPELGRQTDWHLPDDLILRGCIVNDREELTVVTTDLNQRLIWLCSAGSRELLFESDALIEHIAVSQAFDLIAWTTSESKVFQARLTDRKVIQVNLFQATET